MSHDPTRAHGAAKPCGCAECDNQQLARNHFFTGKLMVERDFTDEQRYFRGKDQRHNRYLHGSGVVCGLKVVNHPTEACRSSYVIIEPGVAIDSCGREILVHDELHGRLTDASHEPHGVLFNFGAHPVIQELRQEAAAAVEGGNTTPPKPHKLQFCLRYKECGTEEIPVLYDECGCDETKCAPNRILESYEVDVLLDPPVAQPPDGSPSEVKDCCDSLWNSLDGCPECADECIVLATVEGYDLEDKLTDPATTTPAPTAVEDTKLAIARLDNRTDRRLLPSTQALHAVVECLCETKGSGAGKEGPKCDKGDKEDKEDKGERGESPPPPKTQTATGTVRVEAPSGKIVKAGPFPHCLGKVPVGIMLAVEAVDDAPMPVDRFEAVNFLGATLSQGLQYLAALVIVPFDGRFGIELQQKAHDEHLHVFTIRWIAVTGAACP